MVDWYCIILWILPRWVARRTWRRRHPISDAVLRRSARSDCLQYKMLWMFQIHNRRRIKDETQDAHLGSLPALSIIIFSLIYAFREMI